ncbi:hypothetical protein DSO57_1000339 [Entomophthora muscae]|uniref:Uncharacterized protein n=1 Tax=Entomophthora muscae TaxID=34485 RepID=A0ACC2TL12_9FUNG|nr:hypothetical protein DSO57_1000339 [Entomophthora muscae]
MKLPDILTLTLDLASATSALVVIILFILIKNIDRNVIDRVSIRLQLGIAFADFFKHCMSSFSIKWDGSVCVAIGFLSILLYHIYMCLNICIAMNLTLVILCGRRPNRKWEPLYWTISIIIPLSLNIPVLGKEDNLQGFMEKVLVEDVASLMGL